MPPFKVSDDQIRELYEVLDVIQSAGMLQAGLESRLEQAVWNLQLVSLAELGAQYQEYSQDLATQMGKQIQWEAKGMDYRVTITVREALSKALIHGVRNAIDHGIELPEVRKNHGKPPRAKLKLEGELGRRQFKMTLADDGAGPQWEQIRSLVGQLGWKNSLDNLEVLFEPGFSTRTEATDVSGRGMGLDAVRETLRKLGGTVKAEGQRGAGFNLQIQVPLHEVGLDVVRIDCADGSFCVPVEACQDASATTVIPSAGRAAPARALFAALGWEWPQFTGSGCKVYGHWVPAVQVYAPVFHYFRALDESWGLTGPAWIRRWMQRQKGQALGCSIAATTNSEEGRGLSLLMDHQTWAEFLSENQVRSV